MYLNKLSVAHYKCFDGREDLSIRPLTVLIGRNSSGKSVIARLPLLLRHALSGRASAPIDLEIDGHDFGASFVDLVHGRSVHGALGIGFDVGSADDALSVWFEVQHIDEQKLQVVKRLDIADQSGSQVSLKWTGRGEPSRPRYRDADGGEDTLEFAGLHARGWRDPAMGDRATALLRRAYHAFEGLRYLGPFRSIPERSYRYPGGTPRDVGKGGERAPDVLGADRLRGKGAPLLAAVGDFYERNLGGWRLDVDSGKEDFSLVLRRGSSEMSINLVDAGVGFSQVLPLIVQRSLDGAGSLPASLEIVEQPELHLHPGAHAALADLYIEAINRQPNARFIVETHAEIILLRIRRRIAEGKLDPKHVAIYWISDDPDAQRVATLIPVDDEGGVEVWPQGVFSEDFAEFRAIERARRLRRG